MNFVDRLACRREGHDPALTITHTSGLVLNSYITFCIRCGKVITVEPAASPPVSPT